MQIFFFFLFFFAYFVNIINYKFKDKIKTYIITIRKQFQRFDEERLSKHHRVHSAKDLLRDDSLISVQLILQ